MDRRRFLGCVTWALATPTLRALATSGSQADDAPSLVARSAASIARAIRAREVSVTEVVSTYVERLHQVNPWINAVVVADEDAARARAREADRALARGEHWGPLHGVPMTIKDSLDTAGMVTTYGLQERAERVPARDATVVARARDAGAILLGKTNTPPLTFSFDTSNAVYGATNNPYAIERSPGGSSGGAAAAVAAGLAAFDIGSDTGGSVRQPAHFCGVAGIRPTTGRVPRTGNAIPPGGLLDRLTQIGPLARWIEDLALVMPLLVGPDGRDPAIAPVPWRSPVQASLPGLKAALYVDNGIAAATPATAAAVRAAGRALVEAGVEVGEARPPGVEATYDLYVRLFEWDGGAWRHALRRRALNGAAGEPGRDTETVQAGEVVALIDRWDEFRRRMLGFMQSWDLIICPVSARPALPQGEVAGALEAFSYTMTYSLAGWPAVTVRAGTSPEGLPIGVQLVAAPWREDIALAAAEHIERALGGWQPPPL